MKRPLYHHKLTFLFVGFYSTIGLDRGPLIFKIFVNSNRELSRSQKTMGDYLDLLMSLSMIVTSKSKRC